MCEDLEDEVHASEVYDATTKKKLIEILTSQCHFAAAVTLLLMTVYPPADPQNLEHALELISARADDLKESLQYWESKHMIQTKCVLTFFSRSARLVLYQYISFCLSAHKNGESTTQDLEASELDLMDALTTMNERVKRFVIDGTAGQLPIGVVAYTVAPQILLNINLRLSRNDIDRHRQEQLLKFYTEISRLYSIRYDVAYISAWIRDIMRVFDASVSRCGLGPSKQRDQPSDGKSQSAISTVDRYPKGGLSELLSRKPAVYFELVAVVDYSISTGRGALEGPCSFTNFPSIERLPRDQEPNPPKSLPAADSNSEEAVVNEPLSWSEMETLQEVISGECDFFSLDGMWPVPASTAGAVLNLSDNESTQLNDAPFLQQSSAFTDSLWRDLGLCGE
ncbi:unnamed protein product [Aspergillus oryzae]|nr:unnamed protein product [Aspergillus oryzae]